MPNFQLNPLALLSVVLAGGLAMHATPEPFGWLQTLTGITLLIVLFAFDDNQRTATQSIAFGAVCGFCLMLAASGFISHLTARPGSLRVAVPGGWLSVVWVGGALLFFFIDLMRVGNRTPVQTRVAAAPASQFGIAPIVAAPPVPTEHVAPPAPSTTPPEPPEAAPPVAPPAGPAAPVHGGPPPKQALIYVNLLGEGMNMMRAVATQDLGRGYYLIVEPTPEGEQWEFQTGQVVRCEKKKLASGKHLVAVAEAPRA